MAKKKLSDHEIRQLRAAYEAWNPHDPDSISADELAAQFGITKQTMYNLRKEWLLRDRNEGTRAVNGPDSDDLEAVVRYLSDELIIAKITIRELERRLEELEA